MSDRIDVPAYLEHALAGLSDVSHVGPALGGLLAAARGLLGAESAYLLRREGGRLLLHASDALPDPPEREIAIIGGGPEGRAAAIGEVIVDRAHGSHFAPRPELAVAAVPLRLRGETVGVLAATRMSLLVPGEVRWLRILAQIAGVAMENARLLESERRRARYGETVSALATLERVEVGPFCQRMAAVINDVMNADITSVLLHRSVMPLEAGQAGDPARVRPELVRLGLAARDSGEGESLLQRIDLAAGGALAASFLGSVPYRCADATQNPKAPAELRGAGMRAILSVPIPGDTRSLGLLIVASRRPSAFVGDDSTFLRLVAERVGLLLRHAEIERERARTAARHEFLTVVSHELKTPIAVIKAYAEVLARRAELTEWPAQDRRVVERVQEQADRMLGMIQQLLDLRRLEVGLLELQVSRFDLAAMARRTAEAVQTTTEKHRLEVEAPTRLLVRADRRRVEEVVTNLLENAVKYSPSGGRIVLRLSADDETAHLSVADDGVGIPSEDLGRIFDRFYQVGAGRYSGGHVGLGLGLYIAQEIVERHGGRIWAESVPGQGATFHVVLPLT